VKIRNRATAAATNGPARKITGIKVKSDCTDAGRVYRVENK